ASGGRPAIPSSTPEHRPASSTWLGPLTASSKSSWIWRWMARVSGIDLRQLPMGPLDGILGRHALYRLRVHVGDDVLGHDLRRCSVGWPGIAGNPPDLRERAERQHNRIILPQRMVLPLDRRPQDKSLLRSEPLVVNRLRVNPPQEVLGALLIF